MTTSRFLPIPLSSISFEDKFHFSSRQTLPYARRRRSSPPKVDIWNVKAPDFSIRLYRSVSEPKEKKKMEVLPTPAEEKRVKLPKVTVEKKRRVEIPKFETYYRAPDAAEAEMMFVKNGKYPKEKYKNPTPHNFRPLDEELPHFITSYNKHPDNLQITLHTLDTIHTPSPPHTIKQRKSQLDTFRPAEPQWDPSLLLPAGPWPPKSASYTRHRRRRGAYSAFLERVEDKLTRSWQKS
ncbi:uncharacterized protein si:dkey-30e9.6 [Boleophthalmus pectinirostris]|uniref:uncharacterized protein si:dkey-30e9.6 n=1 Tax=Boleophthalmus pectinirostris TaxID=150288 RepID=UPI00242E4E94|nr:uncharacterized protein si:dkey-30e9.6 [Boleophthalmus pectinirostris]